MSCSAHDLPVAAHRTFSCWPNAQPGARPPREAGARSFASAGRHDERLRGAGHGKLSEPRTKGRSQEVRMSRDPNAIEREIEETRAELARTVDLIAERLSPKRAASRGATKVRE